MDEYVYATMSGVVMWGGTGSCITLERGEIWFADDPFVKDRPDLFFTTPPVVHSTVGRETPEPQSMGATVKKRLGRPARG